jgi:cob(I)alamin adenosyltransferase
MPKLYTKRGDLGKSDLFYSRDIDKSSLIFEALGNIDELNSFLGLLMSELNNHEQFLKELPHILFDLGAMLAMENVNAIDEEYIHELISTCEQEIDRMTAELTPLKVFIVPGGSKTVSLAHVCRTVTRRAERSIWQLDIKYHLIGKFLNRLSDYFFTLSRFIAHLDGELEYSWKKRGER